MSCTCFIIPQDILERLCQDASLSDTIRRSALHSDRISAELRRLRKQTATLTTVTRSASMTLPALASMPVVQVYDCKNHLTLPGWPIEVPKTSSDVTASRAFHETAAVANFYREVFLRNSLDDAGATLVSSIHYGVDYNNAMWNGSQMVYGDGDKSLFVDFTASNDVIGHELTHGVIQHTLRLAYAGEAGGLNESLSDCFGSMFRQWRAQQDVLQADWLIGHDILGPAARAKGYTCLRNLANPDDPRALAPQPTHYSQITPSMDPHYSSGPPNLAFFSACNDLGGKSWETVGPIWYLALTSTPAPNMKMRTFANLTRKIASQMADSSSTKVSVIDKAWKRVGL